MYINNVHSSYAKLMYGGLNKAGGANMNALQNIAGLKNQNTAQSKLAELLEKKNSIDTSSLGYVQDLKTNGTDMKSAIGRLKNNAFHDKVATSSDTGALNITSQGKTNLKNDITVEIGQLARGQENRGDALNAKGAAGVSGYQQFEIEVGGKTHQISYTASASDTNEAIQQKMADAINAKGIGVTASLSRDAAAGTSALDIKAKGVGASSANEFAIRDVYGSSVKAMGAGNVTQEAQNAVYSVNGEVKTSESNNVDLGGGIKATLQKESTNPVRISMEVDGQGAAQQVRSMVSSFNNLLGAAADNGADSGAKRLTSQLGGLSKSYASSLARVGIDVAKDGTMTIDETRMNKAIEDGSMGRFMTQNNNTNYGFSNRLEQIAGDVSNRTGNYVGKSAAGYGNSAAGSESFYNILQRTQNNNPYSSLSVLFDMWV